MSSIAQATDAGIRVAFDITHNLVKGKLADAELHFTEGPLAGMRLVGFSVWEGLRGGNRAVTFPSRSYTVNGERRTFALFRPREGGDPQTASENIRTFILTAYARKFEPSTAERERAS